uniref:Prolyl endopeptidase n=1 Tax=Rhabditophanes sp. KR3021 TaxID=114890 RepID=A0AC35TQ52_9BILA
MMISSSNFTSLVSLILYCGLFKNAFSGTISRVLPRSNSINDLPTPASLNVTVYPLIRRDNTVVDDYFGRNVTDPYRYLEDPSGRETMAFVKQLNAISQPFFDGCKVKDKIEDKMLQYLNFERFGQFAKAGDYYYYSYNTGLQNHASKYRRKTLTSPGELFLDVNKFSPDGLTSMTLFVSDKGGAMFAYALSEKGSDWVTVKFINKDKVHVGDVLKNVKHSNLEFTVDGKGILYSSYPSAQLGVDGRTTTKDAFHSLYYHKMGTDQSEDVLIFDDPTDGEVMNGGYVSDDGKFLFVLTNKGTDPNNKIYIFDVDKTNRGIERKPEWKELFKGNVASYSVVDNDGDDLIVLTDKDAPMGKIVKVNIHEDEEERWDVLIGENAKRKIVSANMVGTKYLLVACLEDVTSTLYLHDARTGNLLQKLDTPAGSIDAIEASRDETEFFYFVTNQISPATIYRGDVKCFDKNKTLNLTVVIQASPKGLDPVDFQVKQVFYPSKDGTKIPMFIFHRKDLVLNGNNPVLLEGYGGFSVAYSPSFSASRSLFVKHFNGIVCVANIRGGSEYGEFWHESGKLHNKQNVFDDFIAGAEFLVKHNYSSPSKISIRGSSNGGLLTAAVSQQRPDLFGGVITKVGVLDMIRFPKFTVGGAWIGEYGNPDVKEDFEYIYKYSPLHNLILPNNQTQWPSTLITTADHDDRVVPSHSLKYIAELYHVLQAASMYQSNPVLALVEESAGHGSGKPLKKVVKDIVDELAFLQQTLNMDWNE